MPSVGDWNWVPLEKREDGGPRASYRVTEALGILTKGCRLGGDLVPGRAGGQLGL